MCCDLKKSSTDLANWYIQECINVNSYSEAKQIVEMLLDKVNKLKAKLSFTEFKRFVENLLVDLQNAYELGCTSPFIYLLEHYFLR